MVFQQSLIEKTLPLYIHIPYCIRKCDYCDFFSIPCGSRFCIPDTYIEAVITEVTEYRLRYGNLSWSSVYFGGGTPSLLSPAQIKYLVQGICGHDKEYCQCGCEFTMEMNPEDITVELLNACAAAGINRLSIGIQSLHDAPLKVVHRRSSRHSALTALGLISAHWNGRLSVDLIAGLPGQTKTGLLSDIDELITYPVDHISLYALTIESQTPLDRAIRSGILPWSADHADTVWIAGARMLEQRGFLQYEISNFAIPGHESRHNSAYWAQSSYVGCGAGATGTFYGTRKSGCTGCSNGIRWTNTRDINEYISFWLQRDTVFSDHLAPCSIEYLDADVQEFEYLMLGFRRRCGVSAADYYSHFGKNIADRIGTDHGVFARWRKLHYACSQLDAVGDVHYMLTARGILFLNDFLNSLL